MVTCTYAEWSAEYAGLLKAVLSGRRHGGPETALMCARMRPLLGGRDVLPVNYGRTALDLAFGVFREKMPERTEVIVPAYICPAVVDRVRAHGLIPIAVDVTDDLNIDPDRAAAAISSRTLAVVAAHMYGCPAAIGDLEQLCAGRGVFLVDDAAQVVGVEAGGRPLGTFGDVGLISFSQSKTIVCGSLNAGGLLIVNNPALREGLVRRWDSLSPGRHRLGDLLAFLWHLQLASVAPRLVYHLEMLQWRVAPWTEEPPGLLPAKMANASAVTALHQLASLPSRLEGRRRVVEGFRQAVARHPSLRFPQYQASTYLTRIMLLLPEDVGAATAAPALRAAGVNCRMPYPLFGGDGQQPIPRARALHSRLIEVPSHSRMPEAAIAAICAAVERVSTGSVSHRPAPQLVRT
jgi:dTDP-4-amino-4,6-dideoxygalactose transaminase